MKILNKIPLFLAVSAALTLLSHAGFAQEETIEEIITLGSRNVRPRSAANSPVPVDVLSGDEFRALGSSADITDNLKAMVPSFTATPATGDGSAFVRPTSLRGMAPDQTLVLVNGKRRHRSALVHFFAPAAGNGAHGVDIGMIPAIALKRVEVLRDGAAAQYGSDAIAGVMNFQLRDESAGGEVILQYGEHYQGEQNFKLSGNVGFTIGNNGFLNLSIEHVDNEGLSRGIQRPDAAALIAAGAIGVGADSPFDDAPLAQSWGRPESVGTRFYLNGGFELNDQAQLYYHGNLADTEGRYRFFYRNPGHSTLVTLVDDFGYRGSLLQTGYTPFLDGDMTDQSFIAGIKGNTDSGLYYDLSMGYGKNQLDYFLNNTTNPSLGLAGSEPAQRDFDVGGYEQSEIAFNADFSMPIGDALNLAWGFELREETYTVNSGEFNSYFGAGSNGLNGFRPEDSGEFDRANWAVYVDLEQDFSDSLLLQYALRYEDFDDFGNTLNGKIASLLRVSDVFTLRGAISTGFHAPTPGQSNVRTTITTFDGATGEQVEEGLVPPTSVAALAVGGAPLSQEKSWNYSLGFTTEFGFSTTLTVDIFKIDVEDRIYRTGDIAVPGVAGASISFYTNALDIDSEGVDVVLSSSYEWSNGATTDISFAFSYNRVEVRDQTPVGGILPVSAATIEDIENNYPNERFVLTTNTRFADRWNLMLRANYYGEHFDERGTISAAISPSAQIDATVYLDAELGYDYSENLRFVLGASNIFDEFIDTIGEPNANRLSVGLQYPRRSAANYEGGAWYLRSQYRF